MQHFVHVVAYPIGKCGGKRKTVENILKKVCTSKLNAVLFRRHFIFISIVIEIFFARGIVRIVYYFRFLIETDKILWHEISSMFNSVAFQLVVSTVDTI